VLRAGSLLVGLMLVASPLEVTAQPDASRPSFEHVHALTFDAAGRTLWLGAHTGLYRSEDGGRTWGKGSLPALGHGPDVMAIAPHPGESEVLYVEGPGRRSGATRDVPRPSSDPDVLHDVVTAVPAGGSRQGGPVRRVPRARSGDGQREPSEPADTTREFAEDFDVGFPIWLDPDGRSPDAFGVRGHPSTVLLDRKGRIVARIPGERSWNSPEARRLVEWLLAEGRADRP
jgi:hypothetical protein